MLPLDLIRGLSTRSSSQSLLQPLGWNFKMETPLARACEFAISKVAVLGNTPRQGSNTIIFYIFPFSFDLSSYFFFLHCWVLLTLFSVSIHESAQRGYVQTAARMETKSFCSYLQRPLYGPFALEHMTLITWYTKKLVPVPSVHAFVISRSKYNTKIQYVTLTQEKLDMGKECWELIL